MPGSTIAVWPNMKKPAQPVFGDADLLEMLRSNNEDALAIIYSRYWSKLYLSAYAVLNDQPAAEDIVQDIMVQLWVKRHTSTIESLQAYLYAAVRYQVYKAVKAAKTLESIDTETVVMRSSLQADSRVNQKDVNEQLRAGVGSLPEKCRQIFELSRKEYLSTKEIANRLGLAPKTVENQLTIALRRLRSILNDVLF